MEPSSRNTAIAISALAHLGFTAMAVTVWYRLFPLPVLFLLVWLVAIFLHCYAFCAASFIVSGDGSALP